MASSSSSSTTPDIDEVAEGVVAWNNNMRWLIPFAQASGYRIEIDNHCKEPVLKKAFLFSCLTGLRKSDVKALTWKKIQPYGDGGMYITVRMQKTQQLVNNPVSEEALELIESGRLSSMFLGPCR